MNCREISETLSDYLDDDLTVEEGDELEAHVERCATCQVFLNTVQRTVEFCRDASVESINDAPRAELRQSLKQRYIEAAAPLASGR